MYAYWQLRLEYVKHRLEQNNFTVFIANNAKAAGNLILNQILPETQAKLVAYGDSMTLFATGVLDAIQADTGRTFLDPFAPELSLDEKLTIMRKALDADLFITGTNAITEKGQLVSLDSIGNRIGGMIFGPRHVVIVAGRNKIVPTLEDAMTRIRTYAAPANAMRKEKKTPCAETGRCHNCKSPERICNTWAIMEKSNPKGRIRVILINESLGL